MGEAFGWGFIAASSLLLGGLLALRRPIGLRPLWLVMAFGSGVLISAVAYELVEEAFSAAGESDASVQAEDDQQRFDPEERQQ